ncbi:heavy metal-responsive transcriptional regulator [Leptolyngbya sp. FACHB-261]|uniref:heavy metal-responsive transcriptional regulator n=1 Tax=Leptolyngbya sp. FACHB-261 TaxID=2692806 RepID=UPI001687C2CC|nr:heavy metal-responsive transcriptional regulator [Leptolyngbya sp. FACHB-261]MBD2103271.1 heavy metal-responsive transcriptional regulator [Leptolyngbya sp. FACHB-261]
MTCTDSQSRLKIGQIARESGLSVKTIRYYEDMGLLSPTVDRTESGYRIFTSDVLVRLSFIKRAQKLGLSLEEIQQILQVYDYGNLPCSEVKHHLEAKITEVERRIQELLTLKQELQALLQGWQDTPPHEVAARTICPNLQAS